MTSVARTDVIIASFEMKEFMVATKFVIAMSWIHWRLVNPTRLVHCLFLARSKVVEDNSDTCLTLWTNCALKCRDAVLLQFIKDMISKDCQELKTTVCITFHILEYPGIAAHSEAPSGVECSQASMLGSCHVFHLGCRLSAKVAENSRTCNKVLCMCPPLSASCVVGGVLIQARLISFYL